MTDEVEDVGTRAEPIEDVFHRRAITLAKDVDLGDPAHPVAGAGDLSRNVYWSQPVAIEIARVGDHDQSVQVTLRARGHWSPVTAVDVAGEEHPLAHHQGS